jgi:hypothetical protein
LLLAILALFVFAAAPASAQNVKQGGCGNFALGDAEIGVHIDSGGPVQVTVYDVVTRAEVDSRVADPIVVVNVDCLRAM